MVDRPNLIRIYNNLVSILDVGLFPGHLAPAVDEARQLITNMAQEMTRREQQEVAQQASDSSGVGTDADRVDGGDVSRPRRKGRGRKKD